MYFGWQDIAALGVVLAAAGYLSRLAFNAVTSKQASGCGSGCGSCSAQSTEQRAIEAKLVSIQPTGRSSLAPHSFQEPS